MAQRLNTKNISDCNEEDHSRAISDRWWLLLLAPQMTKIAHAHASTFDSTVKLTTAFHVLRTHCVLAVAVTWQCGMAWHGSFSSLGSRTIPKIVRLPGLATRKMCVGCACPAWPGTSTTHFVLRRQTNHNAVDI